MICKRCKRDIGDNEDYCPICGEPIKKDLKENKDKIRTYRDMNRNNIFISMIIPVVALLVYMLYELVMFIVNDKTLYYISYPGGLVAAMAAIALIIIGVLSILASIITIILSSISYRNKTLRFVKILFILGIVLLILTTLFFIGDFLYIFSVDKSPYLEWNGGIEAYVDSIWNILFILFSISYFAIIRNLYKYLNRG